MCDVNLSLLVYSLPSKIHVCPTESPLSPAASSHFGTGLEGTTEISSFKPDPRADVLCGLGLSLKPINLRAC